ncbi:MAG: flagellar hook basal-body protein [Tissierella sp.]|nr:flagellar hook basal-body protein [Tissierella sp.]
MNSILNIGKTGLHATQRKMDALADDIANVNTYGYKRKDISFQELLTNQIHENDVILSDNANNTSINMGTKSGVSSVNFQQGAIIDTPREFDMAIEGQGFFGIFDGEGNLALTRDGNFHLNPDGSITNASGYYLSMDYELEPEEWSNEKVVITPDGRILQNFQDEDMEEQGQVEVARVVLYHPESLNSLIPLGEGRYLPNANAQVYNSIDNEEGFGNIRQYALEQSNVDLAKSLTEMIISQRAYSLSMKTIQTTDEIMQMTNNIK